MELPMEDLIVLASTSRYRKALLSRLGFTFEVCDPKVDELAFHHYGLSPKALAERLAQEKASAVAPKYPSAIIIGSDQLVSMGGTVLGKPGTATKAAEQLQQLSGKTHELITAVALWHAGKLYFHTDVTRLSMASLTDSQIRRYVELDSPLDCAGSYKIEGAGPSLLERVEGEDPTAIEGLPLIAVSRLLRKLGIAVP